jgi:hypothetical protein
MSFFLKQNGSQSGFLNYQYYYVHGQFDCQNRNLTTYVFLSLKQNSSPSGLSVYLKEEPSGVVGSIRRTLKLFN